MGGKKVSREIFLWLMHTLGWLPGIQLIERHCQNETAKLNEYFKQWRKAFRHVALMKQQHLYCTCVTVYGQAWTLGGFCVAPSHCHCGRCGYSSSSLEEQLSSIRPLSDLAPGSISWYNMLQTSLINKPGRTIHPICLYICLLMSHTGMGLYTLPRLGCHVLGVCSFTALHFRMCGLLVLCHAFKFSSLHLYVSRHNYF